MATDDLAVSLVFRLLEQYLRKTHLSLSRPSALHGPYFLWVRLWQGGQSHPCGGPDPSWTPRHCQLSETARLFSQLVAKQHGQQLENGKGAWGEWPSLVAQPKRKPVYCLAIDATMIPGATRHIAALSEVDDVKIVTLLIRLSWSELSTWWAGRTPTALGKRLWDFLENRQLRAEHFHLVLGDGTKWIWNLVALHLPYVA